MSRRQGLRIAPIAVLLCGVCWAYEPVFAVLTVGDIVEQVSQTSYADYLDSVLYAHSGDNRGTGAAHNLARDAIYNEFGSLGLTMAWDSFDCARGTVCSYNVVGTHSGTAYPDQMYIVGAHYDSLDNAGADDNASGVAAIMEAARVLSGYRFEKTIVFIAFDKEEHGLVGSRAYVEKHGGDDVLAMVSMDMIAYNGSGLDRARIYSNDRARPLKESLADAIALYGDGLLAVDSGPTGLSDHDPFQSKGLQACLLTEYDIWSNPYWHGPGDSVDTPGYIDYAYATNMVRGMVGFLAASAVPVPEPAALLLLALGSLALLRERRR